MADAQRQFSAVAQRTPNEDRGGGREGDGREGVSFYFFIHVYTHIIYMICIRIPLEVKDLVL